MGVAASGLALAVGWLLFPTVTFGALSSVLLTVRNGAAAGDCLGGAASGIGDIDGDGLGDYIVGAPKNCSGGTYTAGYAEVFSGRAGSLLYRVSGGISGDSFGSAVGSAGDVNGDGVPDLIVGAPSTTMAGGVPGAGAIYGYSGVDGQLLYRIDGGTGDGSRGDGLGGSIAGLGDIDGDGRADFAVSAVHALGATAPGYGSVFVFSGATGTLLYRKDSVGAVEIFGSSVSAVGDVDGDSRGDFIVAAPNYSCGTPNLPQGAAYLYSGAAGGVLRRLGATELCTSFGQTVSGCADIDGDGHPDLVVGAPGATIGILGHTGSAFFLSSATGAQLRRVNGVQQSEGLGSAIADVGDVDGDGHREVVIGAPYFWPSIPFEPGTAIVYSAELDSVVWQLAGSVANDHYGSVVAGAGDVNGDGRDDLLIGSMAHSGGGSVLVYGLVNLVQARGFSPYSPPTINLGTSRSPVCLAVEPVANSFDNASVVVESVVMRAQSDDFREVVPQSIGSGLDTDQNGISEIAVCFSKDDLRRFFGGSTGEIMDTVRVEGNLTNGDRFRATVPLRVNLGSTSKATVAPNPMRRGGTISFRMAQAGLLRVRIFDISGRLVRTLQSGPVGPGYHDLVFDGMTSEGRKLPSGLYFYRVETPESVVRGEFVFLR